MKVILLEDVKSVGKKGEVVTVKDGYAKNFILKKNLGVEATSKNLNDLKLQKQNDEKGVQRTHPYKDLYTQYIPYPAHFSVLSRGPVK